MSPKLALLVYLGWVVWLFRGAPRQGWSKELWIPLIWILIVATHPISVWWAFLTGTERAPEGSNLDTVIFLGLILTALRVLVKRGTNWHEVFSRNKWVMLYFSYTCLSILWSEHGFTSLKLWVKDFGNLPMVLVLLSQKPSGEGVKATLVRAAYVFIPLSILLVKYFPDLGRSYDIWSWQAVALGASESKNALGAAILLSSIGLLWNMFEPEVTARSRRARIAGNFLMIVAVGWLLWRSNCATALACTVVALIALWILRRPVARIRIHRFGLAAFILVPALVILLQFAFGFGDTVVGALGRDMTFTGRTPIWQTCIAADTSPLFGSGYADFWRGDQAVGISHKLGMYFTLAEAHNGYLETYLNGGLVGLAVLCVAIASTITQAMRSLASGGMFQGLRLVLLVLALIYNFTESAFAGLNAIWFFLLLAMLKYPSVSSYAEYDETLGRQEEAQSPKEYLPINVTA